MPKVELEGIFELEAKATPGPWSERDKRIINRAGDAELGNWLVATAYWDTDRALITALRNAVPMLRTHLAEQAAQIAELSRDLLSAEQQAQDAFAAGKVAGIEAATARIAELEGALQDVRESLVFAARVPLADPYIIVELRELCERVGYGNVMASASALWRQRLGDHPGGEFVCSPCRLTVEADIARIDQFLARTTLKEAPDAQG